MNDVLKLKKNGILKGCGHCPLSALESFSFRNITNIRLSTLVALEFLGYSGRSKTVSNLTDLVSQLSHVESKESLKLLEFQFPFLYNGYNNTYFPKGSRRELDIIYVKHLAHCLAQNRCSLNNI